MSTKATQCAKVELQMAVISVLMRLTSTKRLQFSQAFNEMKVARKVETFDASSTEAAIRKGPRLIGFVHDEVDGRECKAAFKGKGAQLRCWSQIIGGMDQSPPPNQGSSWTFNAEEFEAAQVARSSARAACASACCLQYASKACTDWLLSTSMGRLYVTPVAKCQAHDASPSSFPWRGVDPFAGSRSFDTRRCMIVWLSGTLSRRLFTRILHSVLFQDAPPPTSRTRQHQERSDTVTRNATQHSLVAKMY